MGLTGAVVGKNTSSAISLGSIGVFGCVVGQGVAGMIGFTVGVGTGVGTGVLVGEGDGDGTMLGNGMGVGVDRVTPGIICIIRWIKSGGGGRCLAH